MATLENSDLFVVQRPAGGNAGTYKVKWEEVLSNINAQGGSSFKGVADFTDINDDPAPDRANGDQYINSTDGKFAWTDASEADIDVLEGDSCFWSQDDGVWYVISSGGGGGGAVSSVDATAPLLMNGDATIGDVIVESREASTTQSGHVNKLATAADVAAGTTNAVVTADLLKDANDGSDLQAVTDRGNNTTNNITLGTDKITLDATDGSGLFAGNVETQGTIFSGLLTANGLVNIAQSNTGSTAFLIQGGGASEKVKFKGDGSAEFAGDVTIDKELSGGQAVVNIKNSSTDANSSAELRLFSADGGSSKFKAGIRADSGGGTDGNSQLTVRTRKDSGLVDRIVVDTEGDVLIGGALPDDPNISLKADGSATFAGKVTSASTEDTDSGTTLVTKDYIDGAVSGAGYWNRTSGVLSPGDITDDVRIGGDPVTVGIETLSDLVRMLSAEEQELYQDDIYALNLTHPFVSIAALTGVSAAFKLALERVTTDGNINLNADGSAEFAGDIFIGPSGNNITLVHGENFQGSAIGINGNNITDKTQGALVVQDTTSGNNVVSRLNWDGSAAFAGAIEANGLSADYLRVNSTSTSASAWLTQIVSGNGTVHQVFADGSATFASSITTDSFVTSIRNEGDGTMSQVTLGSSNGAFPGVTGWGVAVKEQGGAAGAGCFISRGGDIEAQNSVVLSRGTNARGTIELNGNGIATFGTNSQPQITLDGSDGSASFSGEITGGGGANISGGAINVTRSNPNQYCLSTGQVGVTGPGLNSETAWITASGSATFAGTIEAAGYEFSNLSPLP